MAETEQIRLGTIIWADLYHPITRAPEGVHPAVVLNTQAEIDSGMDLRVAGISTDFPSGRLPAGWFPVHAQPGGHPVTGLDQACVVKATWMNVIPIANVLKIGRRVKRETYKLVQNWLADKEREKERSQREPNR